ncbi:MAG: hypothetical protein JRJ78_14740 [Deltaproteobacteria bacterium]|nr:hypothetical protein [Deltaproteobacteria bacterium]
MTIAVSVKVHDGLVLAADSASTLIARDPKTGRTGVSKVYNNANKVSNLHRNLPIGIASWGAGSIGNASISTLFKDLRNRFMGVDREYDWSPKTKYTMEQISNRVKEFFFDECYQKEFSDVEGGPSLGFLIAGYSSGKGLAELWRIDIENGKCSGPVLRRSEEQVGIDWGGEPEAMLRLLLGFGSGLELALKEFGVPEDKMEEALKHIRTKTELTFAVPPMPIQDAIDLATFLVDATINIYRFLLRPPIVGGPVDVAAITKHEGFKWIKRKHYYCEEYNPRSI